MPRDERVVQTREVLPQVGKQTIAEGRHLEVSAKSSIGASPGLSSKITTRAAFKVAGEWDRQEPEVQTGVRERRRTRNHQRSRSMARGP